MKVGVHCDHCGHYVRWDIRGDTTYYAAHTSCNTRECEDQCCGSDKPVRSKSKLPGWHPHHVCGMFCDGQDGSNSQCAREKRSGAPSAVDQLGNLVRDASS